VENPSNTKGKNHGCQPANSSLIWWVFTNTMGYQKRDKTLAGGLQDIYIYIDGGNDPYRAGGRGRGLAPLCPKLAFL
jgi:hypothetical protein